MAQRLTSNKTMLIAGALVTLLALLTGPTTMLVECGGKGKGGEIVMYNNKLVMTGTKGKPTIVIGEGSSRGGGHHEALKEHQHTMASQQQEVSSAIGEPATKTASSSSQGRIGFTQRLFRAFGGRSSSSSLKTAQPHQQQQQYYQAQQMQQRVGKTSLAQTPLAVAEAPTKGQAPVFAAVPVKGQVASVPSQSQFQAPAKGVAPPQQVEVQAPISVKTAPARVPEPEDASLTPEQAPRLEQAPAQQPQQQLQGVKSPPQQAPTKFATAPQPLKQRPVLYQRPAQVKQQSRFFY